ncbi:MAG: hypothetical protein KAV83_05885 [Desulfobacterales bacterium]|nr:hypothetical protein [Desulfobacterales bacterium]
MKNKGFILLGMLFLMLLLAVTAVALNRRAGLQARMAGNQAQSVQTSLGQVAGVNDAIWELTKDPCWRTSALGEDYTYNGTTYNRKVLNSTLSGYTDAITVSVTAPGAASGVTASFRYYLTDMPFLVKPTRLCRDTSGNIYLADLDNHCIFRVDGTTGAMTRVAGDCTSGFSGDGGPATDAQLNQPSGVWVDAFGVIYIADTYNHRIRKVDLAGNINTIAGTGSPGFSGDNGPATSAELKNPTCICGDSSRNIYIADKVNHCIRKVDTSGTITTVAGKGGQKGSGGNGGQATDAKLNSPGGVSVDASGNIYIADTNNNWVRRVDAATGNINRLAGVANREGGYDNDNIDAKIAMINKPMDVFADTSGDFFIADANNNRIRKVDTSGIITTVAGDGTAGYSGDGGPATSAHIDYPIGVCLKNTGEIVIADTMNSCLRQVDLGDVISTLTGTGDPLFNKPSQIAMDGSGNVYIADRGNHRIRKVDTSGKVTTVAGTGTGAYSGDEGPATSAEIKWARGVFVDTSGNIYIADTLNHRIRKVDTSGIITTVAGTGTGAYSGDEGPATSAEINVPQGVCVDNSGNLYIADMNNYRIRKVGTSGIITTVAGNGNYTPFQNGVLATSTTLNKPMGVFVDSSENIFIADRENHRIRVVSAHDNKINTLAGTGSDGFNGDDQPAVEAQLNNPMGVVMAATRGGRKIYISDTENNRIRMLTFKPVKEL